MISIERVCKQEAEAAQQRGSLHMPGFYFLFPGRATFPKSTSTRAGALFLQSRFQRKLPLVPLFSQLSSSPAWHSYLRVPIASSLQSRTIFHTKLRLFVPRPQNGSETLTKMCCLRKLCCSEVRKQLPLGVYPAPLQSKRTLVSQSLQLQCKFWHFHGKCW